MLILHAAWLPAEGAREPRLSIWAEHAEAYHALSRRARRPGRAHPYAAKRERLSEALAAALSGPERIDCRTVAVFLPSGECGPLPSPLVTEGVTAPGDGDLAPAPWRVEALLVDAGRATDILPQLVAAPTDGETAVADDLRYWAVAGRFTLDLLIRQQFLPTIEREKRRYAARWKPLLDEWDDAVRFGALVRAMPPASRATAWKSTAATPEPQVALRGFLEATVDALAREAMAPVRLARSYYSYSQSDVWLEALGATRNGTGGSYSYAYYSLPSLYPYISAWTAPALGDESSAEPFRLCLRLRAPEGPDGSGGEPRQWTLEYLLQAKDDPSLLVPAGEIWRQAGPTFRFLNRRFDNPQELLLKGLGRAARLFAPIEDALRTPAPVSCLLSTAQAYDFICEGALRLRENGIGVLAPGFSNRLGLRLRLGRRQQRTPAGDGPGMFGLDTLVNFDWQVALGGESLSREEFEALARLKEPLVNVRGQWVELQPEMVEQALKALERSAAAEGVSVPAALRMALAPEGIGGLTVEGVDTEGWFDDLLRRLTSGAGREMLDEPAGFAGRLRPYQKVGISWLATLQRHGLGACLADDMGLGKTPQMIALLLHQRKRSADQVLPPALVICPTSVVGNWRHELKRFAPSLHVLVHHGAGRSREAFAQEAAGHDVVISSYPLLHRDARELESVEWSAVILDEAQNVKNPSAKAAQTARRLRTGWRAALTGTPVENRLSDLWSIFQFLNPGYLGSGEDFRRQFANPIERGRDQLATQQLKALVSPFILRRVKTDRSVIADLPEKNEMKVYCTLTREQATLYQAVVEQMLRRIDEAEDGLERRGRILAALTRLKQVCNHPALFLADGSRLAGRSGKLARLTEMLEEVLAVDDHALVFTQFAEMGELLVQHLPKEFRSEVLFLYGGTPAGERDAMVQRFQGDGDGPRIFVLSLKAGGTGLNLTRANHVFHFDRWWNPAVENQATDRAFRIGQRRDVQVHKFICAGTLEEAIDNLIERKVEISEAIVGTNETWITEMTTEQLRDLLLLRRDALEG